MHSVQVYQNPCLYVLKGNSEEKRKHWNARKQLKLLDQYAVKVDSVKKTSSLHATVILQTKGQAL